MKLLRSAATTLAAATLLIAPLSAQDAVSRVAELRAEPASPSMMTGQSIPFRVVPVDAAGNVVEGIELRIIVRGGARYEDGRLYGEEGGSATVIASVVTEPNFEGETPRATFPLEITFPPVVRVEITKQTAETLYAGTAITHSATALHADGSERPSPTVTWSSSNPTVATVDARGMVMAHAPGSVTIHADAEGARGAIEYDVTALPADRIEITGGADRALQGDVLTFQARLTGPGGPVGDAPILWTTHYVPDDSINAPGAAGIVREGKFVGEAPGHYFVVATAGDLVARTMVDVRPRNAIREVEVMGQGQVTDVHTSDLWVYEGVDGRDYAVTGTWGGDGIAYFWDVTEPTNMHRIGQVQVDARTVNDVKASPDGRYVALSREGTSTRANGPVLVDLADPMNPTIAGYIEDARVTGGVHNMFATDTHLFALAGGDKYVIFDVRDIYNPVYVSEYDHPDSGLHDVWVYDGIAYSSEWANGVVAVDVGNGQWGGSIENPVFINNVPYPVGRTHAAFPYYQESTGKVYLFLGDEILSRRGAAWAGAGLAGIPREPGQRPTVTSGYIHIIDFTDPMNPKDVARYEVPEYGTHNLWVEDDLLYVAYYEGGVRTVDVSGELLGNLATQGREVAVFKAYDPNGFVANGPMAWGPQPFKGNLFFSDFNSGLWSIKLAPVSRPAM